MRQNKKKRKNISTDILCEISEYDFLAIVYRVSVQLRCTKWEQQPCPDVQNELIERLATHLSIDNTKVEYRFRTGGT